MTHSSFSNLPTLVGAALALASLVSTQNAGAQTTAQPAAPAAATKKPAPAPAQANTEPPQEDAETGESKAAEEGSSAATEEATDAEAEEVAGNETPAKPVEEPSEEPEAEVVKEPESNEEGKPASDEEGWMKLEAESSEPQVKKPDPRKYFRTMLIIEGTAKYGGVAIAAPGTTLEDEDEDPFEQSVGNLGGQATLGVMPGGSAFAMAGRLRAGSYISQDFTRGNVAAEMLFGANFARNVRGNEFTHILAGFGVEFLPGENQDLLTLSASAGTVLKGVSFGGGLHLGANDEIAIGTLGFQMGWGQLF